MLPFSINNVVVLSTLPWYPPPYTLVMFPPLIVVVIEVDNHKDAYMLFESLNNRGVPLTAIDLIKNLIIID